MHLPPLWWNEDWLNAERLRAYPRLFMAGYLVLGLGWVLLGTDLVDLKGKPLGYDFITFWAASDLALQGRAVEAWDVPRLFAAEQRAVPASSAVFLWHYPPTFLLAVLPLALLPYLVACLAWVAATLGLYLAAFRRRIPGQDLTPLLLASPACFVNAFHGQNGFLSAVVAAIACLNLERRPVLAGLAIGLLAAKPHLGLLFPLVLAAGGYWAAFLAAAASGLAFCGLATLAFGLPAWTAFWDNLPLTRAVLETGVLPWHKMPSVFAALRLAGAGVPAAYALHAILAAAVAGLTVLAWRRQETPLALRSALLGTGMLLISPYGFDYDLVILTLPLVLLAADGLARGWLPGMRTVLLAAWLMPLLLPPLAERTGIQLMPVVLLALFGWTCARIRQELPCRVPLLVPAGARQ